MNTTAINRSVCPLIVAFAAALLPAAAQGQAYPVKPVKIVVGSAAGGPIDLVARLTAQKLSEAFNQQFIVENRLGAGGTIAGEYVAKAARDGYTLYTGSAATLCIAPAVYPKLGYDPIADFSPISVIAGSAFVMVLHPSIPVRSLKEFVALAKARPGQLRFGSAGSGSGTHLSAELFKSMAKIDVSHVPYKGGAPAIIDVLRGEIEFMFATVGSALPHVKAGKLRALGVTGSERSSLMRGVPTIAEGGVAGYESTTWFGLLGPAGVPGDSVDRLGAAIRKAVGSEEFRQRMLAQALEPIGNTPDQFAQLIKRELPKWANVVRASKARAD
ncbi:MAG: tripartite tricarboxylate transporter substrate binding protein [Betaproteobacteria bacterium]|nr:tripartite tricarboxylate transporter substrate binding protein [Betaproteobacteria bacterium]